MSLNEKCRLIITALLLIFYGFLYYLVGNIFREKNLFSLCRFSLLKLSFGRIFFVVSFPCRTTFQ